MYKFKAFGLVFCADFKLEGLKPITDDRADVTIHRGEVPAQLPDSVGHPSTWQAAPGRFQIKVPDVARFRVLNGSEIIYDPEPGASNLDLCNFLYSSVFAALMQQREFLTLHASASHGAKGAVLFVGRSGFGKSTLVGQCAQLGMPVLADDMSAVRATDDGKVSVAAAYPRLKLTETSIAHLGVETNQLLKIGSSVEKYFVPADTFGSGLTPVSDVVLIRITQDKDIRLDRVSRDYGLKMMMQRTFRRGFMLAMGYGQTQFDLAARLASTARIWELARPANLDKFEDVRALLPRLVGLDR